MRFPFAETGASRSNLPLLLEAAVLDACSDAGGTLPVNAALKRKVKLAWLLRFLQKT
jgi:hypothetical protein